MYINEERLNTVIFVTTVSAVQLVWEKGLTVNRRLIKKHILRALADMMGEVIYEYEYVNKVMNIALNFILMGETDGLYKLSFENGTIDSMLLN